MAILQNKFIREDGSVIGSSVIISCKYTSEVNSQTNLTVGDTTAAEVDAEIRNLAKEIAAGEKLIYYQIEDGVENLIGIFYAEAPTIATKTSVRFKAYDGKAKLATDFSEWLNNHQDDFPMSLRSLVQAACEVAGVTLASDSFQFDGLSIPAFYADGVTSRQVVSWAAQIAGCFVGCKTSGEIFFDWYKGGTACVSASGAVASYSFSIQNGDLILTSDGEMPQYSIDEDGNLVLEYTGAEPDVYIDKNGYLIAPDMTAYKYAIDGLTKNAYTTGTIDGVQFKQSSTDVGVIYPADADGNVFSISQNGIAALLDSDTLRSIAQYLYEKLKTVTYTPLTVKLPKRTANIKAGDIISVTDGNGNTVTTYVMKVYLDAGGTAISSTGDQNYADKAAVSSEKYKNIPGKVLEIEKSVDGLRVQNADTAGNLAELSLAVDGLTTRVESTEKGYTSLAQTADDLSVEIGNVDGKVAKISATIEGLTVTDDTGTTKINGSSVETSNLYVNAANIVGALTFGDGIYYIDPSAAENYLNLPGLSITSSGAVFDGKVTAISGTIAGWTIDDNSMRIGTLGAANSMWLCNVGTKTSANIGTGSGNGWCIAVGTSFGVKDTGQMYATDVDLSGKVSARTGAIGNWTISDGALTAEDSSGNTVTIAPFNLATYVAGASYSQVTPWATVAMACNIVNSGLTQTVSIDGITYTFTRGVLTAVEGG